MLNPRCGAGGPPPPGGPPCSAVCICPEPHLRAPPSSLSHASLTAACIPATSRVCGSPACRTSCRDRRPPARAPHLRQMEQWLPNPPTPRAPKPAPPSPHIARGTLRWDRAKCLETGGPPESPGPGGTTGPRGQRQVRRPDAELALPRVGARGSGGWGGRRPRHAAPPGAGKGPACSPREEPCRRCLGSVVVSRPGTGRVCGVL